MACLLSLQLARSLSLLVTDGPDQRLSPENQESGNWAHMSVLPACMCVHDVKPGVSRGQKRASDPRELVWLWAAVSVLEMEPEPSGRPVKCI